jgi:TatA/E family protein of Tat protein translocase
MPLSPAFIEGIGGPELMMIMFIILLLFGANKLPELAKGLGKSVREFKKAASGVEEEVRRAMAEKDEPQPKKFPASPPANPSLPSGTIPPATPGPPPPPPPDSAD